MKKYIHFLILPLLVLSLVIPVLATDDVLQLTSSMDEAGEKVYITLNLMESVVGDSVSVSYTYDSKYLTPVKESCSWVRSGVLQDFDVKNGTGVWTVQEAIDLKGGLCILAFEKKAAYTQTEISCSVSIKGSGEKVGTYKAKTVLKKACDHSFGDWENVGEIGHSRTCSVCQAKETASHQWEKGKVIQQPDGTRNQIYTCSVCKGEKSTLTDKKPDVILPETTNPSGSNDATGPVTLMPENSDNDHDHGAADNTGNTGNTGNSSGTGNDGHDHSADTGADTGNTTGATDDHSDHDHGQTAQGGNSTVTGIVVAAAVVVLVGTAIWLVKKKKV